jgi:tetratricopeptide (TPR) repeat protein
MRFASVLTPSALRQRVGVRVGSVCSTMSPPPQPSPVKGEGVNAKVALLAALFLAGCASNPLSAIKEAVFVPPPATTAKPAPAAPKLGPSALNAIEAPVPEAAQREFTRALQAQRAGRNDEAQRALETLAKSNPELGGVHANLGLLHRAAGRHPASVAALEKAVAASPKQARFWNELGVSYRHAGQFAKAQAAYERALAEDGNSAAAALNLGILHDVYQGDAAKALPLYERALTLTPGDANISKWVADVRKRAGATNTPATPSPKKEAS